MKRALYVTVIAVILIGAGVFAAQKQNQNQAKQPQTFKIGFMGPLSGGATSLGEGARAGVELTVQETNDAGGINGQHVELVSEDSKCTAAGGTNAAAKLITIDHVAGIVGDLCSSAATPAAISAQQNSTPMISYCASASGLTKIGDYIFRTYPSDTAQSQFAATYVRQDLQKKNVAILSVNDEWGHSMHDGFIETFKQLGGTIVGDDTFLPTDRDFRTQVQKTKGSNPDMIVVYAAVENGVGILKQLRELQVTAPVIGGDFWDDPTLISGAGAAAEGVMLTVGKLGADDTFKSYYQQKTGKELRICGPQAYDAAKLLIKAMKEASTNGAAMKENLAATKDYKGASGTITFNTDGDIANATFSVKQVTSGQFTIIK